MSAENGHTKQRPASEELKAAGYWIHRAPHQNGQRHTFYWSKGTDECGDDEWTAGAAEAKAKEHHAGAAAPFTAIAGAAEKVAQGLRDAFAAKLAESGAIAYRAGQARASCVLAAGSAARKYWQRGFDRAKRAASSRAAT